MSDRTTVGGRRAVVEALRAGRVSDLLIASGVRETQGLRAVTDAAAAAGVDITETDRRELDRLAPDHQGVGGGRGAGRPPPPPPGGGRGAPPAAPPPPPPGRRGTGARERSALSFAVHGRA